LPNRPPHENGISHATFRTAPHRTAPHRTAPQHDRRRSLPLVSFFFLRSRLLFSSLFQSTFAVLLACFSLMAVGTAPAYAGNGVWTNIGPEGGSFDKIIALGNGRVYAGKSSGFGCGGCTFSGNLQASNDEGLSWNQTSIVAKSTSGYGPASSFLEGPIAIDKIGRVYTITQGGYLGISDDKANIWSSIRYTNPNGSQFDFVNAIAVASDYTVYIGTRKGLFKIPPDKYITGKFDGPFLNPVLIPVLFNTPSVQNFPETIQFKSSPNVVDLVIDKDGTIFASTDDASFSAGQLSIQMSKDGGINWTLPSPDLIQVNNTSNGETRNQALSLGQDGSVYGVKLTRATSNLLSAGLFKISSGKTTLIDVSKSTGSLVQ
jgi:hypothetical protein